ncbi:hypothetical protein KP509_27G012300 [Ceratopteris richardii]|uniref:Uncharacterized protein n=1 Tax=Ceratopteris richardii TaxID=49495 RepID=A0A8T2RG10_CERRI|nr:hypothetical protein KP509_27G012300 [Ceratopteris richardii]
MACHYILVGDIFVMHLSQLICLEVDLLAILFSLQEKQPSVGTWTREAALSPTALAVNSATEFRWFGNNSCSFCFTVLNTPTNLADGGRTPANLPPSPEYSPFKDIFPHALAACKRVLSTLYNHSRTHARYCSLKEAYYVDIEFVYDYSFFKQ